MGQQSLIGKEALVMLHRKNKKSSSDMLLSSVPKMQANEERRIKFSKDLKTLSKIYLGRAK